MLCTAWLINSHPFAFLQLMATLVGEIVLSCKEVNQKTRAAANDTLVDIAHAMHGAAPPSIDPGTQWCHLQPCIRVIHDPVQTFTM